MLVSNFLESREQARVSKMGGAMMSESASSKQTNSAFAPGGFLWQFTSNVGKVILPAMITMFCGTFTYPIAVRVARKVFRLRGFYPIHCSIAPFLALVHVNIFGTLHAYFRIKLTEMEFESLRSVNSNLREKRYTSYNRSKELVLNKDFEEYSRSEITKLK